MQHWLYVLAAYLLTAAVLVGYWRRTENRLSALEKDGRRRDPGGRG